ncbi:MAG: T9SS type A sorting domain-containing protein [Lentimicrobium sp.]
MNQLCKYPNLTKIQHVWLLVRIMSLVLLVLPGMSAHAQCPEIDWKKSFGGTGHDNLHSIQHCVEGGFVAAGYSHTADGDITQNHGEKDFWVVRLTDTGSIVWQKSLGGSEDDHARSVIRTNDGGFVAFGSTSSNDGDITGSKGGIDYWIVKLDDTGNMEWQKSLGGSIFEYAHEVIQTTDGGFAVVGFSDSGDGDITGNHGNYDYWVVKLDGSGEIIWQKALGGSSMDQAFAIRQTTDGGYIIAGASISDDGDVTHHIASNDCWIVKLDASGNLSWEKSYGGRGSEFPQSIVQTIDGGYVFAGWTESSDGDVTANHGQRDAWVVKLNSIGDLVWQHSFGGSMTETASEIRQLPDGNYIVCGYSFSDDGDLNSNKGEEDFWILKLDFSGNMLWQQSFGGSHADQCRAIAQSSDGSYILSGSSDSNDGDVTGNHGNGNKDGWVLKLYPDVLSIDALGPAEHRQIYPNPAKDFIILQPVNGWIGGFDFVIRDSGGRLVMKGKSVTGEKISLETLTNGCYFIEVTPDKSGSRVFQFIRN